MVDTVLSQKPRRLQRFRNESSFAQSLSSQRVHSGGAVHNRELLGVNSEATFSLNIIL